MTPRKIYIPDLCYIIALDNLRSTPKVQFDLVPDIVNGLSAIDRVKHEVGAISPSIKGEVKPVWYMHPDQEDNVMVFNGRRIIELFSEKHGKKETFEVTSDLIKHNGKVIHEGECILGWGTHIFHRIQSPEGSLSVNFAKHFENFDLKTNFNIYELNEESKEYKCLREGHRDQPAMGGD